MSAIRRNDDGITMLQTVLVIVILGALAFVALPIWNQFTERSRVRSCQSNQRAIVEAMGTARADRNVPAAVGYYDSVLDVGTPWGAVLIPNYLSKTPRCPVSGERYFLSPIGRIWSDRGLGQYQFVGQGTALDHRLAE